MARKSRKSRRSNPMAGTFVVTHAPAPHAPAGSGLYSNPASKKAMAKYHRLVEQGFYDAAARTLKRIHAGQKGAAKRKHNPLVTNPAYKATFTSSADRAPVRKALKQAGFESIKLRSSTPGKKRKAGPYAQFVKSHMKGLLAQGMSTGEAMKQIGALWRAKGAKSNPAGFVSVHGMGMMPVTNPRGASRRPKKNPYGSFQVVYWKNLGDLHGKVLSRHDTLKEAQAAHKAIVMKGGQLIKGYEHYGIEGLDWK